MRPTRFGKRSFHSQTNGARSPDTFFFVYKATIASRGTHTAFANLIDLFQRSPVVELPQTTEPPWPAGTHDAQEYRCEHARCMTCATIVNLTRIKLKSESRPIHGHFTCETRALVYLITCSRCNAVYVGETGQKLRERLNGRRADIRNGNYTLVGVHFCQPGHELRVSGLKLTSKNATSRKVRKRSWIDFFKKSEVWWWWYWFSHTVVLYSFIFSDLVFQSFLIFTFVSFFFLI